MKSLRSALLISFLFSVALFAQADVYNAAMKAGVENIKKKDFKGAIAEFTKAMAADTSSFDALKARAQARLLGEEFAGAVEDYDKIIARDPSKTQFYVSRGTAKNGIKDYKGAVADFSKAIELDPQNAKVIKIYQKRVDANTLAGDKLAVIEDLGKMYKMEANADYVVQRANLKLELNDTLGAIKEYDVLVTVDPTNEENIQYRAFLKNKIKDNEGSIADLTKVIELNGKNTKAFISRGLNYLALSDKAKDAKDPAYQANRDLACADFTKAKELGETKADDLISKFCKKKESKDAPQKDAKDTKDTPPASTK